VLYGLDFLYTTVYENAVPRNKMQHILALNSNDTLDYVFLGNSRVENSIKISTIEKQTGKSALNLGTQGATLVDLHLFLQLLVDKKIDIGKIYVQVDNTFNMNQSSDLVNYQAMPYIKSNAIIKDYIKRSDANYYKNYYIPFYRYATKDYKLGLREFVASSFNYKAQIDLRDGFRPLSGTLKPMNRTVLPEAIYIRNLDFEKIDAICKAHKIDVTYYCAPYCDNVENAEYTTQLKLKIKNFKDFSKAVPSNEMFTNCSHLNETGANYFTELLIKELDL